jgi:hypothetical protein
MKSLIYIVAFFIASANCIADEFDKCKIHGFERPAWTKPDSIPNSVESAEELNPKVVLHPNPTGGSFIISSESVEFFTGSISIADVLGQIVIKDVKFDVINKNTIEISDERFKLAPTGTYFLSLNSAEQSLHLKLIKIE